MSRVMFVARHFWPHCSGRHESAAATFDLTQRLANWGMRVEVVTPRHGNTWPTEIMLGDVRVHRVASAPRGDWSTQRYVRHLSHWLAERMPTLDAIVCDQLREESRAVSMAIESGAADTNGDHQTVGVAMCGGWGDDSDQTWCQNTRSGKRILQSCGGLDSVITENAKTDRYLVSHGVLAEKLRRRPIGFPRPAVVTEQQRNDARLSLRGINLDLTTDLESRVLLWCGPMSGPASSESGVGALVQSARFLAARDQDLRIWILGDGKIRDWVHTELKAEGVRGVVAIPGSFSDMTEIWHSVDAVVQNEDSQLRSTFPAALAAGIPIIIADRPAARDYLQTHFDPSILDSLAWYDPAKPSTLRKAFRSVWGDLEMAKQHAFELARDLSRRHPLEQELAFWQSILRPSPNQNLPSPKAS
ncbi:glycosyl transferase, group 1 family protein [Rhodopirellula baltica WH47]|uniref:Glycosyl transferase, group 1 family protein n=1 Tax=Rhodopirellula baltica WH47 TaxID=991778 RepID=F2AVY7_RHOBT|nr:glycosyl transferase, group 1 family protein [Rhodopirellula baltica WH47]